MVGLLRLEIFPAFNMIGALIVRSSPDLASLSYLNVGMSLTIIEDLTTEK